MVHVTNHINKNLKITIYMLSSIDSCEIYDCNK